MSTWCSHFFSTIACAALGASYCYLSSGGLLSVYKVAFLFCAMSNLSFFFRAAIMFIPRVPSSFSDSPLTVFMTRAVRQSSRLKVSYVSAEILFLAYNKADETEAIQVF
jgi:hypothetical protein